MCRGSCVSHKNMMSGVGRKGVELGERSPGNLTCMMAHSARVDIDSSGCSHVPFALRNSSQILVYPIDPRRPVVVRRQLESLQA